MQNEFFGWLWIVLGMASGALLGLRFYREDWLGGYGSWRRRMIRLGHISFFGLGLINIFYALSAARFVLTPWETRLGGGAMIAGGVLMPLCCGLAAWRQPLRMLFPLPVICLLVGAVTAVRGLWPG